METKVKKSRKRFTKEEDLIIIEAVKASPTNIVHAISVASEKTKRSPSCINRRYYKTLRNNPKVAAITCGSAKGFTQNVKNIHRNDDGTMPDQNLKGFMFVMREMLDLTPAERKKIIDFFK